MLRVNNIYPAFMGEVNKFGIGAPCTFVRLAGCNLRCFFSTKGTLCDTPEALAENSGELMDEKDILDKCAENNTKVICLTGGEPLLQDVTTFLTQAITKGFFVCIETNGSQNISKYVNIPNVTFIVDRKSFSSGELEKMRESNYTLMKKDDYIKFVIDTEEDYEEAVTFIKEHIYLNCHIAFGLFWGAKISYQWLIDKMREDKMNVILNMQTHKMSCLYDSAMEKNGVKDIVIPKAL